MMSNLSYKEIIHFSHEIYRNNWVANHDGNLSSRLNSDQILITPTATSKGALEKEHLLIVDNKGTKKQGTRKPFGELNLHLAVYQHRQDTHAVIHAHPPYSTAIACAKSNIIETPFIAEAVVSLGASIPTVPFAMPGQSAVDALIPYVKSHDAVLLENHGVLAWGSTLTLAYLRLELVEHLAKIATLALPLGGIKHLNPDDIHALLLKREKSNLGTAADRATSVFNHTASKTNDTASKTTDLEMLVRSELERIRNNR